MADVDHLQRMHLGSCTGAAAEGLLTLGIDRQAPTSCISEDLLQVVQLTKQCVTCMRREGWIMTPSSA